MLVTFKANSRVLNYFPGKIYTAELDPILQGLLEKDVHLQLIDPPTLETTKEMQPWFTPEVEPKTTKPDFPVGDKSNKNESN
jgi:hypothetical protein